MERKEILRIFIENGLQLKKEALDFFCENEDKIGEFLEKVKNFEVPAVIGLDFIKTVLGKSLEVEIIKKFEKMHGEISVSDISLLLSKRYERISKFLERRLELINLISISKISPRTKNFSVIGMVREKNEYENSLILEDRSGEIKVFLDENKLKNIVEDEVLLVICRRKEDSFYGEKVIFPDIPLKREIKRSKDEIKAVFISDLHLEKDTNYLSKLIDSIENFDIVFVLGDVSSKQKDIKDFFSSFNSREKIFVKGEVDKDVDVDARVFDEMVFLRIEGLDFLLIHGSLIEKYLKTFGSVSETLLELLRKRHLSPNFDISVKDENLIIDPVPDIFACAHFHEPFFTNYKGTTIISTGSFITQPIYWIINLKSREILKLDLRENL